MSQYERNSVISSLHFLLETWNHIDKCSQNTGGMFWIYSGTPSTTTRYHDQFNPVFLKWITFLSLTRPPRYPGRGHSPAVTKLLIEHRVTRPPYFIGILSWKTGNLSAAICSAASRCPEASWIQGCRRECKRSKCQCQEKNSYWKLFWNVYCQHRLYPLCDFVVQ